MSISFDNIFSIFGTYSNSIGLNKNDDNTNENIPANKIKATESSDVISYYNKLAKITNTINILLEYFSNGQFNLLSSILTVQLYNDLSVSLTNIKYELDNDYEIMRKSTIMSLQGLQQCMNQYSNMVKLQEDNALLLEENSILHDRNKLIQYINELFGQRTLFPDQEFTVIRATLRPEYTTYIQLYGFPEGGIFDVEKLADIIQNFGI